MGVILLITSKLFYITDLILLQGGVPLRGMGGMILL
jgi:hypothetical protein